MLGRSASIPARYTWNRQYITTYDSSGYDFNLSVIDFVNSSSLLRRPSLTDSGTIPDADNLSIRLLGWYFDGGFLENSSNCKYVKSIFAIWEWPSRSSIAK